ncbi:MAG: copper resistance protein CopC [Enhydrobacter sp.]|nr:copper resistance protein CopC [Enhydrobacter sp.]
MMMRRQAIATLVTSGICVPAALAQSQAVHVLDSTPKAHAVIGSRSSEFFVRFDRPVDHVKSRLVIVQDGKAIETLHPRLESAPEVLFARAPTLPAGDYMLHWSVVTLQGAEAIAGDIPFKVAN